MSRFSLLITSIALLTILCPNFLNSQPNYGFTITATKDICLKASASLIIEAASLDDIRNIAWSSGETNVKQVTGLSAGDYFVKIKTEHLIDSVIITKDTTLYFSISKEMCPVSIDKYFSPNDDNYHDFMGVSNAQYYPNFELIVFNKWGQQVHSQKKEFTPWNGKWNGIDLPDGTYYYVFFYDASQKTNLLKGDVTILR
ncbi:gliding motility-associated C-terminal domain-containing protein [Aurantibacillus circumpalustris]|uniref:gliding motility-associated C-terminal domain-containing protein n=1 Tax=Aurantibacillus circumpalustris TaxID=3036359 RepID=UPI00295B8B86|nr:gliding motility-associated C-terminal domain-containing protein [Aurantibacillus circumpalustris]